MIRVSSHEEFQNAVFNKPFFGQMKYLAIPSNTFTTAQLKEILGAFRGNQAENSPNQMLDLLHAIQNAAEDNNWYFSNQYLVVASHGRGSIFKELAQSKTKNIELEETARQLIQRHRNILCLIDTDILPMDSDGPETRSELDPSTNDKMNIIIDQIRLQNETIRQQEALLNQVRDEYSALQYQLDIRKQEISLTPPDSDEEISSIQSYQKSPFLDDETCSNIMPKRRKPLETPPHQDGSVIPVWRRLSSEVNQMERGTVQRPRRYKAWTLKTLNIQKYDPEQMDIITHVERVTRILEEVNVKPESQKIRLLLASLPSTMDHYEKAVPNRHRNDYTRFSRELVKIMGNKIRVASERFMQCHRQRGEDILRFFFRLCDLFKSSKGLMGDEWQDDPTHSSHIYTKLYDSLYEGEKNELEWKLDRYLERGTLTVARLMKEVIKLNKLSRNKVRGETPTSNPVMTVEATNNIDQEDENEKTYAVSSGESAEEDNIYWEN